MKSESESHSVVSDSLWSHGLWNSSGQNNGVGSLSLFQGIKPRSPALQVDSLPAEPPRESKNTGSVSFLQGIFLTQESNQGFLHYRRILYSLTTREAQISGKIFHANGLEELLLKYPYYSKQSMELMHSLSKCQWHISQNWYI